MPATDLAVRKARRSETRSYLWPTTDGSPTTFLTLPTSTCLTFSRIQSDRADRMPSPNSYDPQPDRLTRLGAEDPRTRGRRTCLSLLDQGCRANSVSIA